MATNREVVVVGAVRTAIGTFGGSLKDLPASDLATIAVKAEVKIDDGLITEIHRQAKGRMRLVLNAIANIEQWAGANSWSSVSTAQVAGKQLCTEFDGKALGRKREAI